MNRPRALRILAIVMAAVVCLGLTGWYLIHRAAEEAAKAFGKAGTNMIELIVPVKGTWGQILLEGVPKNQVGEVLAGQGLAALTNESKSPVNLEGLLEAYRKDPRKFQRYAEVYDTWFHAFLVDEEVRRLPADTPAPLTSASLTVTAPQYRLDAWGHPFCIFNGADQTAIASAGPGVRGFTRCDEVRLTRAQIDHLPEIPITRQPSGALVMVFKRRVNENPK